MESQTTYDIAPLTAAEAMEIELSKVYGLNDREFWPAGPWDGEPDTCEWVDARTGLYCAVKRNRLGALCGYVAVPADHLAHGLGYDALDEIDVHGGLTFSAEAEIDDAPQWTFGFDCNHGYDQSPQMTKAYTAAQFSNVLLPMGVTPAIFDYMDDRDAVYRDFGYVIDQVRRLAIQLDQLNQTQIVTNVTPQRS